MAKMGHSVPAYAYALNNPLHFIDPDGLRFVGLTERERWAINRLRLNPTIGPMIRELDDSSDILIRMRSEPNPDGAETAFRPGKPGGGCSGSVPASGSIKYDVTTANKLAQQYWSGSLWLDPILAHELGHVYHLWKGGSGLGGNTAVDWENAANPGATPRPPGFMDTP